MTSTKRGTVAALACILAAGAFVVPPKPAEAQTLMDLLFGGGQRRVAPQPQPQVQRAPAARAEEAARVEQARRSEPQPVVQGPKYYTYSADQQRAVDFSALGDPVTTGSIDSSPATGATGFAGATVYLSDLRIDALPEVAEAVEGFYAETRSFVWTTDGRINDRATEALRVLGEADSVGLHAEDYRVERPVRGGSAEERQQDLMRFEMEMAVKTLTYVLDATRGRIDPNKISGYHDFERKSVDLDAALAIIARSIAVGDYLEQRSPRHEKFQALTAEWERLQSTDEGEQIVIPDGTLLRPMAESDELALVIEAIRLKGSDALKTDHALTFVNYDDGRRYDGDLVELVKAFQEENGLMADGIVGRNTVLALTGLTNADKMQKVALAMERLRWLNHDLGDRHVLINQPAYNVSYTENDRETLSMRVVVGTKANQTYFFQDELETVEFNPYWGVPQSIIVNEMLPKLRQDPSYLDRLGYEVSTQSGTQIASSSVNWYGVGANVPYNVRQPPGASNALGELKILFPNEHAIYMHDTPAKDLFARDSRAYSHGCVRLEDPRAMAAAVLGTTKAGIGARIADGQNKAVDIEAGIAVYVAYFTAWPNADGEVEYFDDIYERDSYLERAMDATDAARLAQS